MKLFQQYLTSLSFAALLLAPFTSAAECTKRNVDVLFWEEGAVEMMWVMRSWGCGGNWRETKVTLSAPLCLDDGHCFNGWWYYRNHTNQKACWVSIIHPHNHNQNVSMLTHCATGRYPANHRTVHEDPTRR
jgi:hypothetical protein